jgi:hypothetical protein
MTAPTGLGSYLRRDDREWGGKPRSSMASIFLIVSCRPLSHHGAVAAGAFFVGVTTTSDGRV